MSLLRRYRIWKLNRRLERIMSEAGLPPDMHRIFSGEVGVWCVLSGQSEKGHLLIGDELHRWGA